jgi:hypothetical protein
MLAALRRICCKNIKKGLQEPINSNIHEAFRASWMLGIYYFFASSM